jgi:hypothetical protein
LVAFVGGLRPDEEVRLLGDDPLGHIEEASEVGVEPLFAMSSVLWKVGLNRRHP